MSFMSSPWVHFTHHFYSFLKDCQWVVQFFIKRLVIPEFVMAFSNEQVILYKFSGIYLMSFMSSPWVHFAHHFYSFLKDCQWVVQFFIKRLVIPEFVMAFSNEQVILYKFSGIYLMSFMSSPWVHFAHHFFSFLKDCQWVVQFFMKRLVIPEFVMAFSNEQAITRLWQIDFCNTIRGGPSDTFFSKTVSKPA